MKMATYIDESDNLWEVAVSYVDLRPPRHPHWFWDRAKPLEDMDLNKFAYSVSDNK